MSPATMSRYGMHRRKALAVAVAGGLHHWAFRGAGGPRRVFAFLRRLNSFVLCMTTSSWVRARQVVCSRIGLAALGVECSSSRPAGPRTFQPLKVRRNGPRCRAVPSIGDTPPRPSQDWLAASCYIHAARPWEARARSTRLRIRGVIRPPMTNGPKDGATLIFCLTSSVPRRSQAAPARGMAAMVLSMFSHWPMCPIALRLHRPSSLRHKNTDFG